jgi:hypothetical protein
MPRKLDGVIDKEGDRTPDLLETQRNNQICNGDGLM